MKSKQITVNESNHAIADMVDTTEICRIKPRAVALKMPIEENMLDRVSEKVSLPAPKLPPVPRPIWGKFLGQRVRLLLRDGTVIVGTVQLQLWDFVPLHDIEEIGKDYRLTAEFALVDVATIARIYPAVVRFEPKRQAG